MTYREASERIETLKRIMQNLRDCTEQGRPVPLTIMRQTQLSLLEYYNFLNSQMDKDISKGENYDCRN